eukprot:1719987-Rhodomonas_salina.1
MRLLQRSLLRALRGVIAFAPQDVSFQPWHPSKPKRQGPCGPDLDCFCLRFCDNGRDLFVTPGAVHFGASMLVRGVLQQRLHASVQLTSRQYKS